MTISFEMQKFNASEEYRKYLIELRFKEKRYYTVWGTDMTEEIDKMLVQDKKLIVFNSLQDIVGKLERIDSPYTDKENFKAWVRQENLSEVYNTNSLDLLAGLQLKTLSDRTDALEIINCINLIQDFSIQVNNPLIGPFFDDPLMVSLKDFIYDHYFWRPVGGVPGIESLDFVNCAELLKRIHDAFMEEIEVIT